MGRIIDEHSYAPSFNLDHRAVKPFQLRRTLSASSGSSFPSSSSSPSGTFHYHHTHPPDRQVQQHHRGSSEIGRS